MKLVIQRVTHASVSIENQVTANIGKGMLVLLGIEANDSEEDIEWLTSKIIKLRIFDDHRGVMNLDIQQIDATGKHKKREPPFVHQGCPTGSGYPSLREIYP